MKQHLTILWTSGEALTARFLVLPYAANCLLQDWWDGVELVLWGASMKLLAEDEDLQLRLKAAVRSGVKVSGCAASARQLGVTDKLAALEIELRPWGMELSERLQRGEKVITL